MDRKKVAFCCEHFYWKNISEWQTGWALEFKLKIIIYAEKTHPDFEFQEVMANVTTPVSEYKLHAWLVEIAFYLCWNLSLMEEKNDLIFIFFKRRNKKVHSVFVISTFFREEGVKNLKKLHRVRSIQSVLREEPILMRDIKIYLQVICI